MAIFNSYVCLPEGNYGRILGESKYRQIISDNQNKSSTFHHPTGSELLWNNVFLGFQKWDPRGFPGPTLGAVLASKVGENMCIYIHICIYVLYIYILGKLGLQPDLRLTQGLPDCWGFIHLSEFGKLAYFGSEVGFTKSPSQDYTGSQVIKSDDIQ